MITNQLSIRKGFDHLVEPSLKYFNIKSLNDVSNEIQHMVIKFINSSNSKCSKAFWILRHNFTDDMAEIYAKKFSEEFKHRSYIHKDRKSVADKHISKNKSRGYSGYVNLNNQQYYCRSQLECIVLHYLSRKYTNISMEDKIFYLEDLTYKPDFFIYNDDKLIKIIEVKSSKPKDNEKYWKFAKIFESQNIEYEIIDDVKPLLLEYPDIKNIVNEWKKTAYIQTTMNGKNNPRWGAKLSDETKNKISIKAKQRFNDPAERKKISDLVNQTYRNNPEVRNKISLSRIELFKKRRKIKDDENKANEEYLNIHDPYEKRNCVICGNELIVRHSSDKIACSGKKNCIVTLKVQQGIIVRKHSEEYRIKNFQSMIFNAFLKIKQWYTENINENNIDLVIKSAKKENIINNNNGISLKSILKYYGNFLVFMDHVGEHQ